MMRKNAFTLVELLVVIAILSVLAAMLLPSIENSLSAARKLVCANNLRQWGSILSSFGEDNAGKLPLVGSSGFKKHPFYYGAMAPDGSTPFSRQLAPYGGEQNHCKEGSLWDCPDTPSQPTCYYWSSSYHTAYAYMGNRYDSVTGIPWGPSKIFDERVNGRKSILMADTMFLSGYDTFSWVAMYNHGDSNQQTPTPMISAWSAMNGIAYAPCGVNICYIDGSARWINWYDLSKTVYYNDGSTVRYWTE